MNLDVLIENLNPHFMCEKGWESDSGTIPKRCFECYEKSHCALSCACCQECLVIHKMPEKLRLTTMKIFSDKLADRPCSR